MNSSNSNFKKINVTIIENLIIIILLNIKFLDCPRGTYRRDRTCVQCPANTNITLSGGNATVCPCINGFFRGNREEPSESCSGERKIIIEGRSKVG